MAEETKEITLLAVSKRESGVCIAGVDSQLRWIRPVKDRILAPADI